MLLCKKNLILVLIALTVKVSGGWIDEQFASSGFALGGGSYLSLPLYARTAGIAGAAVAWRDNLTGVQYNPAILDATETPTVTGTTSFMTLDRTHTGADIAAAIGDFLVGGLSFMQLGVGKIEGRGEYGELTSNFNSSFNAFTISAAGRLAIPLSFGVRLRYLHENIEKESSNGEGIDFGLTWQPIQQLCIGASAQNVASYIWWSTGHRDEILMTTRLGICAIVLDGSVRTEIDIIKTLKHPEQIAFGAEYSFAELLFARAGIRSAVNTQSKLVMRPEYSFGTGIKYSFLGFDYAVVLPASELGIIHKISISGNIPQF